MINFSPENKDTPIAVLVSGGVDSSVALALLKEQGYTKLKAFYLKIWLEDDLHFLGDCPWEDDLFFARSVCEQFDVELEIVPLQQEYYDEVVSYTLAELRKGFTPSPDLFCNQRIKFGAFYNKVAVEYNYIASGHYARLHHDAQGVHLLKGIDPIKDQTYFLSHLSQEQLSHLIFPIGSFSKVEVREFAENYDLVNKNRKDSQGICFLGKMNYNDFIKHYLGSQKGEIREKETGKLLGEHNGFWFHTIGQRQGLGLGNGPWYVVEKDTVNNIVYVSTQASENRLESSFYGLESNFIQPLNANKLECKVRHGENMHDCEVHLNEDDTYKIEINPGDKGLASGQFVVYYGGENSEECFGASKIKLKS